jgi:hypothetical protein
VSEQDDRSRRGSRVSEQDDRSRRGSRVSEQDERSGQRSRVREQDERSGRGNRVREQDERPGRESRVKKYGGVTSMVGPRTLHSRMFHSCTIQPHTVHSDFFASPYVSCLKEPGCLKCPFPDQVPVHFIPNRKGCVLNMLFPVFLWKDQKHLV